jgi:NAD(P)-dependent dehydrogenase (short-subunit alcohol dehydrogenase family)
MAFKNPFDLTGKVAVITGSSRGIGRSIAETMAGLGAKVVISSRSMEACGPVADAINEGGGTAIAVACNIGRKDEVAALLKAAADAFGTVDSLVCNAAINPVYGPMSELPDAAFEKIMKSNVLSNMWLATGAAPGMKAIGGGSITIVSSIAGLRAAGMIGAYGISKAADMALARNYAQEWGPDNIRVNCIAPGLVKTDFAKALWEDPERIKATNLTVPLRRIGDPADIGGIGAFLASDAALFITGQVIVADGGVTIV